MYSYVAVLIGSLLFIGASSEDEFDLDNFNLTYFDYPIYNDSMPEFECTTKFYDCWMSRWIAHFNDSDMFNYGRVVLEVGLSEMCNYWDEVITCQLLVFDESCSEDEKSPIQNELEYTMDSASSMCYDNFQVISENLECFFGYEATDYHYNCTEQYLFSPSGGDCDFESYMECILSHSKENPSCNEETFEVDSKMVKDLADYWKDSDFCRKNFKEI